MVFTVIHNLAYDTQGKAGFTRFQFQRLDGLFLRANQAKLLMCRYVDCDFDTGIASFSYAKGENHPILFRFVIRRVGPRQVMYELYENGKGRPLRSGLFDRVYEKLEEAVEALLPPQP